MMEVAKVRIVLCEATSGLGRGCVETCLVRDVSARSGVVFRLGNLLSTAEMLAIAAIWSGSECPQALNSRIP